MQISSCITSTKMQGVVIFFAALYCFGVQIGLTALEIFCEYDNYDGDSSIIDGGKVVDWNNIFIKPMIFPMISSIFIFRHMCH